MSKTNLLKASPDAYTRYKITFDLLKLAISKKSSVIDVGGQDTLLYELSIKENYPINLTVFDLREKYPDQQKFKYIQGDITKDNQNTKYDAVVSLDVLEHISDDKKEIYLKNCIALAKKITIIAAPFASDTVDVAEHLANDFYKKNTGQNHPWLAEHFENNKPQISFVENYLKKTKLNFLTFTSNSIQSWLLNILSNFMLAGLAIDKKKVDNLNSYFNQHFYALSDFSPLGYRRFYVISNDFAILRKIKEFLDTTCKSEINMELTYLYKLVETFRNEISDLLNERTYVTGLNSALELKNRELIDLNQNLSSIIENVRNARFFKLWQALSKTKYYSGAILKNPKIITKAPKLIVKTLGSKLFYKSNEIHESALFQDKINEQYQNWYKKNYPSLKQLTAQVNESKDFPYKPLISLIMPTYNTNHLFLRECINSVLSQSYSNWELCIADDNSKDPDVRKIIKEYAKKDARIKYIFRKTNGHICKASNSALKLAAGEYVGLLDHDDILWPNALFEVAKVINNNKYAQFIYSDEDKLAEDGKTHCDPFFKPDWSPHYLRSCNYITHFAVIKRSLIDKIGGFKSGYEGAQDYDLFLRATYELEKMSHAHPLDADNPIIHIPTVLYSWRKSSSSTASENYAAMAKSYAFNNQKKALEADLKNRGLKGKVVKTSYLGLWEVEYDISGKPLVSIIIPTKDHFEHISKCIDSLLNKTTYKHYEVIVVDTGSTDIKVLNLYKKLIKNSKIKLIKWDRTFNFSAVCNFGAEAASGDYLLFLNNDTEVIEPRWIEKMLSYAQLDDVGAVGCKLLYPNNRIQHAGVILGIRGGNIDKGVAGHSFKTFLDDFDYGIFNTMIYGVRDCSAVTAASILISKCKFVKIRGFDEGFRIAFNDVDLNLKLLKDGRYNIYQPRALLYHHESVSVGDPSRGTRDQKEFSREISHMHEKWGELLQNDPFYNKNYSLDNESYEISN